MNNKIKKIVAINDISGLGRCSLTAAIPILSVLGLQCCPFPTAILSCQTGYDEFTFLDFTSEMKRYKNIWQNLEVEFDCIYSGFLGSEEQIEIVIDFINNNKNSLIVIDPVMGDDGQLYSTYTKEMCEKIRDLIKYADVITPNLTEACILLNEEYKKVNLTEEYLEDIAKRLSYLGPCKVIITGIVVDNEIWNIIYDKINHQYEIIKSKYSNKYYGGTGDIFASIVTGMILRGKEVREAVKKASSFIYNAVEFTANQKVDYREGVIFEPFLKELIL